MASERIETDLLEFIPIQPDREGMTEYQTNDFLRMVLATYEEFYPKVGYHPPWIGYLAVLDGIVVGVGGYKGPPVNGTVEIAYGSVPEYEGKGISTETCRYLTELALAHDPTLKIVAHTLMKENASTSILQKNGFVYVGVVNDPEDGEVWEWENQNVRT
jgi:RimJ/RimL family protein N-acetyltransferase